MMFALRWLVRDDEDIATVLEAAFMGSYKNLHYLLWGPQGYPALTGSMKVTVKAWDKVQSIMQPEGTGYSSSTQL